ncbi:MAG: hypothetical protein GX129_03310 [Clostridiales bacterium]|jgi:hypothetical protein|nr:hypothetical protein [Clostridiales bacterium]
MKKGIILIAIGIILLALDIRIPMGDAYPPMEMIDELGEVFQGKIINNLIGIGPKIDVISDVLGYVFLFLGAIFLLKYDFKFIFGMILIPFAIYLYITILRLPYNFILGDLYLKAAGYHFVLVFIEILTELFIIKGVINVVQTTQTKWNVNELLVGWVLAMISKGILSGIHFFYSRGVFYSIYSLVMIGATVFYLNRLYVITKFKLEENS